MINSTKQKIVVNLIYQKAKLIANSCDIRQNIILQIYKMSNYLKFCPNEFSIGYSFIDMLYYFHYKNSESLENVPDEVIICRIYQDKIKIGIEGGNTNTYQINSHKIMAQLINEIILLFIKTKNNYAKQITN